MAKMRRRMEEELCLRGYANRTVETYLDAVTRFVRYHKRRRKLPEVLTEAEVERLSCGR